MFKGKKGGGRITEKTQNGESGKMEKKKAKAGWSDKMRGKNEKNK